ncbi:MAG: dicarboxylate/amino acid:cation symporter [Planctomycetes bacterium]|nr:dicarboxylate/amino acid:cation symporter [Planctomycetota bacterium]
MARRRRLELHWKMLIGLLVGAVAGLVANAWASSKFIEDSVYYAAYPVGQIFFRLIFMVVVPLAFSALVLGVTGIGDVRRVGRMGFKTLVMTVLLSGISVAIGIGLANWIRPGARLPDEKQKELQEKYKTDAASKVESAKKAKSVRDTLLDIIPKNPLQEMVGALDGSSPGGGMLALMFFALAFGVAIATSPERTGPLVGMLEGVYDVCMKIIGFAMKLAPVGVAGLAYSLTAVLGLDILKALGWFVITVIVGLALHMFGVYSIVLVFLARYSPRRFFTRGSEAFLTAFGTASSNATLPTSLRVTEKSLGIRPEVARFVLTVGSTANQNGTALFEGVTVLFLAQVFGHDLNVVQQVTVVLLSVLAGIGTAGVPGGSLPLIVLVLMSVGIPGEGIGIILGVDRLLDMCRTSVNVAGDMAIAACVDRGEQAKTVPAPPPAS